MICIQRAIDLGGTSNYSYRQVSNISYFFKDYENAIYYAQKAINAVDNTNKQF